MDSETAARTVRGILKIYGFEETSRIELVKYRENHVFRLTRPTGASYAVRLHRAGYRTDTEIETELAYLDVLADLGLGVPEVVRTLDNDLMCWVPDESGTDVQVDVQRWIEAARPLGDIAEALEGKEGLGALDFRQLGELTARLHRSTAAIGRLPGFQRAAWDAEGLAGEAPLWGSPLALVGLNGDDVSLLTSALARLRRDLDALETAADRYGVIHADLTPENVLVSDRQMYVIDFDDFGEGWHLFDLATILFFYQRHPLYAAYQQALFDGYDSVRKMPTGFLDAWDTMLLARGLTYLGWAAERHGDDVSAFIAEHVAPIVLDLARRYTSAEASPAHATP